LNDNNPIKKNGSQLNTNYNYDKFEFNNIIKNVIYSFEYKSCLYEYDEKNNVIFPIYMNLSKMMNKDIFNYFNEGLSSERLVQLFRERYGKNEYKLNLNLIYIFFMKSQIPSFVIVIIIGLVEYIYLKNYLIMLIKIFLSITIIVIELIITKISFINKYNNEFTLDGNYNKVKVKRKYLFKNENKSYCELNIIELLPGDILFLKNNDYVPCDCIILNGECIVNESDLTGSLNIYKKIALKNNSE
jgi:cation-transporting ATPase 13A3/4/5